VNSQNACAQQLAFWHGIMNGVLGDCGDKLNKQVPGATVTSIASIYAHMVMSEDAIINGMLQAKPMLFVSDGWEARTGVKLPGEGPSMNVDWAHAMNMDLGKFQEYAKVVFANTDSYLKNVTDAELQEKVQTPVGEQTREWFVVNILATHFPQHSGEIAALKGVQGMKGLPF
jgi:hypothetical protein